MGIKLIFLLLLGTFGTPDECNSEFYKKYMQANSNILGHPKQHDVQLEKNILLVSLALSEITLGSHKDPKM